MLIFRFFHYIWFIDSENLCFILILKEKWQGFEFEYCSLPQH